MFLRNKYFNVVVALVVIISLLGCSQPVTTTQAASPSVSPTIQTNSSITLPSPGSSSISGKVTKSDGVTPINEVGILVEGKNTQSLEAAITATDGTYVFSDLLPDTYTVTVIIPGYETIEKEGIILQSGQKITNLDFALRQESSISGKVTRADGTPLTNVSILASTSSGEKGAAVTVDDGTFTVDGLLSTGTYRVEAFLEEYGFAPMEVFISNNGSEVTGVDISTFKGVIAGKITKADGTTPIAGATVSVQIDVSAVALPSLQRLIAISTTGEDGMYRLESLQTVAYTLQVLSPGYGIEIRQVQVPGDMNGMDVNLSLKPAGSISGRVTQADGTTPISGAKIDILDNEYRLLNLLGEIITDQSGQYTVDNLAEGSYMVIVHTTEFVSLVKPDIVVVAGLRTENINLLPEKAGGSIAGTIYQVDGITPVQGALIIVNSETAGGSTYSVADGTYTITDLPMGKYSVIVVALGYESRSVSGISILAGRTTSNVNFNLTLK